MLTIPDHLVVEIDGHALGCYPEECCGALVGQHGTVKSIWPTRNAHEGSRSTRYAIAPVELLEAHMSARKQADEVIGYYHSHPDSSALPSTRDRETAFPGVSYLIVAVTAEDVCERRSWRLRADRLRFEEERLVRGKKSGSIA